MTQLFNQQFQKEKRRILRSNMPTAERKIWMELRGRRLAGYKFRRQYGIGSYIVDFYCPRFRLAIEIDGDSHCGEQAIQQDEIRQHYIEELGIHVMRFTNTEIYNNLNSVIDSIYAKLRESGTNLP